MLMTQADRDSYAATSAGWQSLDGWCADPANAVAVSRAEDSVSPFRTAWQVIDRGLLTDPSLLLHAHDVLLEAEAAAATYGYPVVRRPGGSMVMATKVLGGLL